MTDIAVYTFNTQQVRTTLDETGEPLFVLTDVAAALGIKDVSRLASRLSDDLRQAHPIQDRLGRTQRATFVTEGGLYEVIIRSDKPEARAFRRWVTHEVLPAIRKTGQYSLQPRLEGAELMARALIEAQKTIEAAEHRAQQAEAQIEADKPHTQLGKAIAVSDGDLLVRDMAAILTQNGTRIGQNRLFEWLRGHNWVCSARGRRKNTPTQYSIERGYTKAHVYLRQTLIGTEEVVTTRITPKGQARLIELFTPGE